MQVAGKAYTQERNEMITLSLDEFGDFEGIKGDNNPIGIAGIFTMMEAILQIMLMKRSE